MSWIDQWRKRTHKKPNTKGKTRTAEERLATMRIQALLDLKKYAPSEWRDLVLADMPGRRPSTDPIKNMADSIKTLKAVFPHLNPAELEEEDDFWKDAFKTMAPALGTALGVWLSNKTGGPPPPGGGGAPPPQVQYVPVPSPQQAALPESQPAQHQEEEPKMGIISQYVIGQLDGKNPEQAAKWLLNEKRAEAFIQKLVDTPEDELLIFLNELSGQYPDFAGVVHWLRQRPDWLMDVIRTVREAKGKDKPGAKVVMGF